MPKYALGHEITDARDHQKRPLLGFLEPRGLDFDFKKRKNELLVPYLQKRFYSNDFLLTGAADNPKGSTRENRQV